MTNIKLTVNGETLMDGDLGQWKHTPPTAVQHLLKRGRGNEPYLQAALAALLEGAIKDVDTAIDVNVTTTGWVLRVTHKGVG